jgi:acetoin utilization protein AcuB
MHVKDLMTKHVETTTPTAKATVAWEVMQTLRIHHLVVMRNGEACGVLSSRDLGGRSGASVRQETTVEKLMSPMAITVTSNTTVREAANLMRGRGIGCLPVVDGSRVVGILTTSDLLEFIGRGKGIHPAREHTGILRRGARGGVRSVR